ncbi:hypothetical protein CMUS01_03552 [Colletotrichum musicola]|uniref:Uncharacterized protein n=1 Tax=Colletotrichum musicola TaxID=2175873 RepID=A0A8H6NS19_9PEZI|nr:hypothetical protein CMUS01_03552 [Colletotrichum musicola]
MVQYTEQSGEMGPFAGVSPESKITTLVRAGFRAYRHPPARDCTPHQERPHDGSRNWTAGRSQIAGSRRDRRVRRPKRAEG